MSNKSIIYPGTFDPLTKGHTDLIERAAKLFDRVIVAIAANSGKSPLFSHQERISLAAKALEYLPNVEVLGFNTLLIDFANSQQVSTILRGLRVVSDFEYEFQLATMNRHIAPHIETVFLTPAEKYMFISSSMIREIAFYGDKEVDAFLHPIIAEALRNKMKVLRDK